MPEAAATAGTQSTPATGDPAAPAAPPAAVAPASTTTPANPDPAPAAVTESVKTEPAKVEPAKTEPAKAEPTKTDPAKAEPAKTDPVAEPPPLFTLPDDVKIADEARTKFETFVKGKLADGKITLTAQELVDAYLDQARDANQRWTAAQVAQDKAWETESKQRFNETQLAAAETGVGWLSSFDPQFREVAKAFKNHPTFVNAMRLVGERLSEDTFEPAGTRVPSGRKAAKDVLYPKQS
jgi:hypothetical protein